MGVQPGDPLEKLFQHVAVYVFAFLVGHPYGFHFANLVELNGVGVGGRERDLHAGSVDLVAAQLEGQGIFRSQEIVGTRHHNEAVSTQLLKDRFGYCHVAHEYSLPNPDPQSQ